MSSASNSKLPCADHLAAVLSTVLRYGVFGTIAWPRNEHRRCRRWHGQPGHSSETNLPLLKLTYAEARADVLLVPDTATCVHGNSENIWRISRTRSIRRDRVPTEAIKLVRHLCDSVLDSGSAVDGDNRLHIRRCTRQGEPNLHGVAGTTLTKKQKYRWLVITIVSVCLNVMLICLSIPFTWKLGKMRRSKRLKIFAIFASRLT